MYTDFVPLSMDAGCAIFIFSSFAPSPFSYQPDKLGLACRGRVFGALVDGLVLNVTSAWGSLKIYNMLDVLPLSGFFPSLLNQSSTLSIIHPRTLDHT